jgi:hypothetical protein
LPRCKLLLYNTAAMSMSLLYYCEENVAAHTYNVTGVQLFPKLISPLPISHADLLKLFDVQTSLEFIHSEFTTIKRAYDAGLEAARGGKKPAHPDHQHRSPA